MLVLRFCHKTGGVRLGANCSKYWYPGIPAKLSVALLTAFYEVLTTMASGALLAAVLLALGPPHSFGAEGWQPMYLGLLLLAVCGLPLLPGVFNRVVALMARRFQSVQGHAPRR